MWEWINQILLPSIYDNSLSTASLIGDVQVRQVYILNK